jgi:hypothetical protein
MGFDAIDVASGNTEGWSAKELIQAGHRRLAF